MANTRIELTGVNEFKKTHQDIPTAPPGGLIVKVKFAGLCHSDVHMMHGAFPNFVFPRVLGHEISGEIHEIGEEAKTAFPHLKNGARVIVYPWGNCYNCDICRADLPYCPNMVLPPGIDDSKKMVHGVWQDGGYQEYVLVHHASMAIPVPEEISLSDACMVPCSGITALNGVRSLEESIENKLKLNGKAVFAVFGTGGLALWAIQIAKAIFPPGVTVVAVDLMEDKLKDAKEHGADITFQWGRDDDMQTTVSKFMQTTGAFIDGAIDFTGMDSVQMKIFALLNVGGTITVVGLGGKLIAAVPVLGLVLKNATIKGNIVGTRAGCTEVFNLMKQSKVKPPPVTEITLDDVEATLHKLEAGTQRGRAVAKI